jgi:hypothetical protein
VANSHSTQHFRAVRGDSGEIVQNEALRLQAQGAEYGGIARAID